MSSPALAGTREYHERVRSAWLERPALYLALYLLFHRKFAYLSIAIRRFYFRGERRLARSRVKAIATALLVYILNSAFITIIQLLGGAIALRSI